LAKSKSSWFEEQSEETHFERRGRNGFAEYAEKKQPNFVSLFCGLCVTFASSAFKKFFMLSKPPAMPALASTNSNVEAIFGLDVDADLDAPLSSGALSKLRWRSRRGMLENDLFIERFFNKYAQLLTVRQANGLNALMDLSDNQLLDLHLGRKPLIEVRPELDTADIRAVLELLKEKQ
jgi:antitoxin CptB